MQSQSEGYYRMAMYLRWCLSARTIKQIVKKAEQLQTSSIGKGLEYIISSGDR